MRVAKKMTQKDLAEILNVTPQAISKWENNKSYPDLDTLVELSNYFKVSTDHLLGNEKQSFFEALFSKNKGENHMNNLSEKKKTYPKGTVPKVKNIESLSSIFKLTFDNGETRYMKSHFNKDIVDAYSLEKGKGKRAMLMASATTGWMGANFEIKSSGEVIVNGSDHYSPEELWYESKASIQEV